MTGSSPWFIKDRKIRMALVGCGRISKIICKPLAVFKKTIDW